MEDYYEILEVHHKASPEVIARAYKVLAARYHPDAQPHERREWAEAQMKRVNQAFTVLKDPQKRAAFDAQRQSSVAADAVATAARSHASTTTAGAQATRPRTNGVASRAATADLPMCAFHPGRPRISTCLQCRRSVCAHCRVLHNGRPYCVECARRAVAVAPRQTPRPTAGARRAAERKRKRRVRLTTLESVVCAAIALVLAVILYAVAAAAILPPDVAVGGMVILAVICVVVGVVFVFAMALGTKAQQGKPGRR